MNTPRSSSTPNWRPCAPRAADGRPGGAPDRSRRIEALVHGDLQLADQVDRQRPPGQRAGSRASTRTAATSSPGASRRRVRPAHDHDGDQDHHRPGAHRRRSRRRSRAWPS
ncbi:MAG: hypothetical protein MZW92_11720 [Comamonadaceae bacterium]|nr:hypothetical protein [Comamonadaceae bacterium]